MSKNVHRADFRRFVPRSGRKVSGSKTGRTRRPQCASNAVVWLRCAGGGVPLNGAVGGGTRFKEVWEMGMAALAALLRRHCGHEVQRIDQGRRQSLVRMSIRPENGTFYDGTFGINTSPVRQDSPVDFPLKDYAAKLARLGSPIEAPLMNFQIRRSTPLFVPYLRDPFPHAGRPAKRFRYAHGFGNSTTEPGNPGYARSVMLHSRPSPVSPPSGTPFLPWPQRHKNIVRLVDNNIVTARHQCTFKLSQNDSIIYSHCPSTSMRPPIHTQRLKP